MPHYKAQILFFGGSTEPGPLQGAEHEFLDPCTCQRRAPHYSTASNVLCYTKGGYSSLTWCFPMHCPDPELLNFLTEEPPWSLLHGERQKSLRQRQATGATVVPLDFLTLCSRAGSEVVPYQETSSGPVTEAEMA